MQWFVGIFEGRRVKEAALELRGYVPLVTRVTKPSRKRQPVLSEVPIFHGWVFIRYTQELYKRSHEIRGYRNVMKYGKLGVLLLDTGDMDRLREIEGRLAEPELELTPRETFKPGELVSVGGLFDGVEGKVVGTRSDGYIQVDINGNFPIFIEGCLLTRSGI